MQTIRITTSQNIDIDYEVAGVGERILAYLIDSAMFVLIILAAVIMGAITSTKLGDFGIGLLVIIVGIIYVFYHLACEIFMNGQSVGKRVMKIKVISLDGGRASIGQYILRWLFRIVDFSLTGGLCALISAAVSKNTQRVGDMVAGTTLIKTTSRAPIDVVAFTPPDENYIPVFEQVTQLNDRDIVLIHEVLSSYIKTGNYELLNTTTAKLKTLLGIKTDMNDMLFLQTLIKDYNQIVAATQTI